MPKGKRVRLPQSQHTFTISPGAMENLVELASRTNALARTGPRHGLSSWRTWLYRFAAEDAGLVNSFLKKLNPNSKSMIHLSVDMAQFLDQNLAIKSLYDFEKDYGSGDKPSYLVERLSEVLGSDILVGAVINIIETTCSKCWNSESGCRCWDDS